MPLSRSYTSYQLIGLVLLILARLLCLAFLLHALRLQRCEQYTGGLSVSPRLNGAPHSLQVSISSARFALASAFACALASACISRSISLHLEQVANLLRAPFVRYSCPQSQRTVITPSCAKFPSMYVYPGWFSSSHSWNLAIASACRSSRTR